MIVSGSIRSSSGLQREDRRRSDSSPPPPPSSSRRSRRGAARECRRRTGRAARAPGAARDTSARKLAASFEPEIGAEIDEGDAARDDRPARRACDWPCGSAAKTRPIAVQRLRLEPLDRRAGIGQREMRDGRRPASAPAWLSPNSRAGAARDGRRRAAAAPRRRSPRLQGWRRRSSHAYAVHCIIMQ